jgi:hypothetical protein
MQWQRCRDAIGLIGCGVDLVVQGQADAASLLLGLVQRHLRSLRLSLDPQFPDEDWGFTAQQAVEKLLKVLIVLRDQRPPRSHELSELAALAEVELPTQLLGLQTYAATREKLLEEIQQLLDCCIKAID